VYDKVDKTDTYWNYNNILDKPYKYLKITGGNVTNIIYQPSPHSSVRVLNYWQSAIRDSIKAYVSNDTLYLNFPNKYDNQGDKYWMGGSVLVRLFGPELLYVDGTDTKFELQKLKQKNVNIKLSGRSRLEVETYQHDFDSLSVAAQDSSQVVFEMSPDLNGSPLMSFRHVSASITGYTVVDVGRASIKDLDLKIADTSAIILSGQAWRGTLGNNNGSGVLPIN